MTGFVADVLPAGHFSEHQQAQLVAGIQEGRALGVVAGAHGIAAQVLFDELGIQPLQAVRHGVALIGVALVPVDAPQHHPLAVQVQATGHELDRAEAEPDRLFVQHPVGQTAGAGTDELYGKSVQGGVLNAPRMHPVQGAGDGQGKFPTVDSPASGGAADLGLQGAAHRLAHRARKIFEKGFLDYKKDIEDAIAKLDFLNDKEAYEKRCQLNAMAIDCDAIIILANRYADLAEEMAAKETDEKRKAELLQIAENCRWVPAHKPRTFWQAIQQYWFVHIGVTSELNPWDAYSPGRLDQHLNPFYVDDVENGRIDRDGALELLECLWVKFNNQPAPPKVGITLKESSTYTDFANINTGGITEDGKDGVNEVSYMILDCMDEMKLLQPSSNVQISRKTPRKFLKRACEISRKGWGQPAFYNTEAIVSELMNAGKSLDDARMGGTSGCVETGAFGNEAYILQGYFNLPKILELTLYDGYDHVGGHQLGLHTGFAKDFNSYEEFFEAYKKQIKYFVDIKVAGSNVIEQIFAQYMPAPFLSILTNDCIRKGKDYNAGGARYNTNYIQGVGIGTITDSLAAIKYNCFDHHNFTMEELVEAMDHNFEGYDRIYHLVTHKTPKYGNDDDYADDIMKDIFTYYRDCVTGRPNTKGGFYRINMLPTTCHVYFGEVMNASPNGRLAHKPVSEGISPEKGADIYGPTGVINSCAKMDQLSTGGTLLNQKFTPSVSVGIICKSLFLLRIQYFKTFFNSKGLSPNSLFAASGLLL